MFQRRLLIVDDSELLRNLLSSHLEAHGFEVRSASNVAEARAIAKSFEPDVALLDVDLGEGPNGFDFAHAIKREDPGIAIVFLTNLAEPRTIGASSKSLPKGSVYLQKREVSDPKALIQAIATSINSVSKKVPKIDPASNPLSVLSNNHVAALRMVAQGYSNQEIAKARDTTERAVRNLLARAYSALNIPDAEALNPRVEAARIFMENAGIPRRPVD